eukprot:TRINITY_DN55062_c0_g1_i1.p2 TRINITY_DN55062_c0_g1~~TRINITY_DN55062_c0_g1_i1.p2  ORF type:complete len:175 (+),score=69.37 TRINITY_DN55062_c0_g1_i1:82-606(+)
MMPAADDTSRIDPAAAPQQGGGQPAAGRYGSVGQTQQQTCTPRFMRLAVKCLGVLGCAAAAFYCLFRLFSGDIPSPKVRWALLFIYLSLLSCALAAAELGWGQIRPLYQYFMLLTSHFGRAVLYVFIGCLLLDGYGWYPGLFLIAVGVCNLFMVCKGSPEPEPAQQGQQRRPAN